MMFDKKGAEKKKPAKTSYRLLQAKDGQRVDYVEIELSRPIKPARSRVEIVAPDKFE